MPAIKSSFITASLLPAALLTAPLLLAAVPPAAAQQSSGISQPSVTDKADITKKAGAEMQEWQHKIDDLAAKAKTDGKHASAETQAAFNDAWAKSKDATARLQHASKSGWADAKKYYDTQTDNLSAAWNRLTADQK